VNAGAPRPLVGTDGWLVYRQTTNPQRTNIADVSATVPNAIVAIPENDPM
jgi:hypothetical protein